MSILGTASIVETVDEDDVVGALVATTLRVADLVLATDIPHSDSDVLVFHRLDSESDGSSSSSSSSCRTQRCWTQLVENDCLASVVSF